MDDEVGYRCRPNPTDDDFLELPVMYETFDFDGLELAAAYNPGIQNLVVANDVLLVPDPEGPDVNGRDPWADSARATLERLGAARDLHRGDDDIGAIEDFIDFGFARRNVREPHDQRKGCGLIETFLLFQDAEGLELACDLLA